MHGLLRFTLDLFAPASAPQQPGASPAGPKSPENPAGAPGTPNSPTKIAKDQPGRTRAAIENIATPEPLTTPQVLPTPAPALSSVSFRHPRALREARLDGIVVGYEFKRGKRRSIGFSVGPDGLAVTAPKWVALAEVDRAVLEKSGWILRKLQETRERSQRLEAARIDWKDGCTLPFLGRQISVVIDPRQACTTAGGKLHSLPGPRLANPATASSPGPADLNPSSLHLALAPHATPEQIRAAVQAWLKRQATRIFTERLQHFAPLLDVQWRKLSLSSASTRWGSASSDGSIRLNWRLIHFGQPVIDYVVVHELSHLRFMDHSPRFWDTVRSVEPDYAKLRAQLKDESIPHW